MENKNNINTVLKFMPKSQAMCFIAGLNGAEQAYFMSIVDKIADVISKVLQSMRQTTKEIKLNRFFTTFTAMLISI